MSIVTVSAGAASGAVMGSLSAASMRSCALSRSRISTIDMMMAATSKVQKMIFW